MRTSEGFSMGVLPPPIMGMSVTGGFDMYIQDRTGGTIKDLDNIAKQIYSKSISKKRVDGRTSLNHCYSSIQT